MWPFKKKKILLYVLIPIILFFAPQIILTVSSKSKIHTQEDVSTKEYGIVFGAEVYTDYVLSPIAEQRADVAVMAYKLGKVKKLYVSGTNTNMHEVETISSYMVKQGVSREDIIKDNFGLDTADTCRHFSKIGKEAILFTQEFHLPRAMFMCNKLGVKTEGVAVNRVLVKYQNLNWFEIYRIRAGRFLRESALTWSYILGIYDKVSNDAK